MTTTATPLLVLNNIEVIYDRIALAIKGASIEVPQGGMVALLGANGAGKSTLLKAVSGLLKAERGEVTRGDVQFHGQRHRRTWRRRSASSSASCRCSKAGACSST